MGNRFSLLGRALLGQASSMRAGASSDWNHADQARSRVRVGAPLVLAWAALLTACLPRSVVHDPLPSRGVLAPRRNGESTGELPQTRWWRSFNDPILDRLVEQTLTDSYSVKAAWARLARARALADQADAALYPTLDVQGFGGYQRSISAFGTVDTESVGVSAPVSFELDVFARKHGRAEAADRDVEAEAELLAAQALSTTAELAEAYYDVRESERRVALYEGQLTAVESVLRVSDLRQRRGMATSLDTRQQELLRARTEDRLRLAEAELESRKLRLAYLAGVPPGAAHTLVPPGGSLPEPRPLPRLAGGDRVLDRPDVRASQRRVEAADYRIGASIADRLPRVELVVRPSYVYQRNRLAGAPPGAGNATASGLTVDAQASLSMPLFDGFAGAAASDAREAELGEAIENMHDTIIGALVEVETAQLLEDAQREARGRAAERVAIAQSLVTDAESRYRAGLSDFFIVVQAIRDLHDAEDAQLRAERALVSRRIQLFRAVGGTPLDRDKPPSPSEVSAAE